MLAIIQMLDIIINVSIILVIITVMIFIVTMLTEGMQRLPGVTVGAEENVGYRTNA